MNYGFVIDNRKCIGCHACSTACKSENEVPLSVNRTWVKYVETGQYPDTKRHFQVTRCNHCENPPCARICPVTAMYQRDDGIVEFDQDVCIGCKACLQACPYDAIYIDPDSHSAAKCHYCAHRIDVGLEPACVVVCPEHAIISGDMDDPNSEISQTLARNRVTVRKPEQGTAPKLFYIEGNDVAMHPTATERTPETYMWADVVPIHGENGTPVTIDRLSASGSSHSEPGKTASGLKSKSGAAIREPKPQGSPHDSPLNLGQGRIAEQMVQVTYNAQHKVPWHWPVAAYLVTKGIAAGIVLLLALFWVLNIAPFDSVAAAVGGMVALIFVGITTGFLVFDLEKPEMFLTILTRPNWRSWLARGAFILVAFSILLTVWTAIEVLVCFEFMELPGAIRLTLLGLLIPLAIGTAVYTAFLFGQAEGRDLWQSTLLPFHLLLQAVMAGSGSLLGLNVFFLFDDSLIQVAFYVFAASLILDLFVTLFGEFGMPHATEVAARAAHQISHGRYKIHFWFGSVVLGHVLPLAIVLLALWSEQFLLTGAVAGLMSLVGLYLFEYAYVMAPQEIPNS